MKSIYEYLDYRQYLIDYYEDRKKRDNGFSYRVWADEAGFKAKDFILRVMRGGSRLSDQSCANLTHGMGFSKSEKRYFAEMVRYNQAKSFEEKEACYSRLHRDHIRLKPRSKVKVMPYDHFEFYSEWYHGAIRSLISSYGLKNPAPSGGDSSMPKEKILVNRPLTPRQVAGIARAKAFKDDFEWLAKNVYPAISVAKARKSVALLEKLGLVHKDASGSYSITHSDIATTDEVKRGALFHFYATGMDLMKNAMEKLPLDKRNISGATVGISNSTYQKVVDALKRCRQEIVDLARQDTCPDSVYQVNFHMFPMSGVSLSKNSNKDVLRHHNGNQAEAV